MDQTTKPSGKEDTTPQGKTMPEGGASKPKANKRAANNSMKNKTQTLPLHFIFGDLITSSFFNRNKFTILITLAMLMFYISIKYKCKTKMETISRLQSELAIAKSECIHEQSEYMSNTRESTMQARIDSMGLDLQVQQQPPYILTYKVAR